jgi:hypothetical protein
MRKRREPADDRIPVDGPEEIPGFKDENEEAAFWRTHRFSLAFLRQMPPAPPEMLPPVDESRRQPRPRRRAATSSRQ